MQLDCRYSLGPLCGAVPSPPSSQQARFAPASGRRLPTPPAAGRPSGERERERH
jgi:hypothetical protein